MGLPQLVEKGIVTNMRKPFTHRGVTVATFCMGDQGTYDYVHSCLPGLIPIIIDFDPECNKNL